ncbi:MAG TPA: DedA family protein [Solirubrobacteraceae bacterium]|nr:DedA family protein [Solirubrobacteraceae bacterium]
MPAAALILLASATDKLTTFATNVIDHLGYGGILVLMTLESACVPIPSEATMLFAGFDVSTHRFTLWGIVLAGVVGNLIGSWIAYAVGYYGRLELLERHRVFHVNPAHLATAERWFDRWGSWAVFFSRLLPIVRTFISLPAGIARMPFWRFTALTIAGCVPWVLALALLGRGVGANWERWKHHLAYADYVLGALIVLGIAYLVVRWWRGRRGRPADATAAP